jgi:hypothetical protein
VRLLLDARKSGLPQLPQGFGGRPPPSKIDPADGGKRKFRSDIERNRTASRLLRHG